MNQQLKAYLISLARLFGVALLGQYILINKSVFELDFQDGKVIVSAGIAAVVFSLANALNPKDQRYGIGAPAAKDLSAGDVATNAPKDAGATVIEACYIVITLSVVAMALVALFGRP